MDGDLLYERSFPFIIANINTGSLNSENAVTITKLRIGKWRKTTKVLVEHPIRGVKHLQFSKGRLCYSIILWNAPRMDIEPASRATVALRILHTLLIQIDDSAKFMEEADQTGAGCIRYQVISRRQRRGRRDIWEKI